MRVLFVITEHAGGVTAEHRERYEAVRLQLASVAGTTVESAQYASLDDLAADVVVLSGSYAPWAAHDQDELDAFLALLRDRHGPVLGICAGMQLQARALGGVLRHARRPSRGFAEVEVQDDSDLFAGLGPTIDVFTEHDDEVATLPDGIRVLARSESCAVEAIAVDDRPWWGTQFHPERWDEGHPAGLSILRRFFALAEVTPHAPPETGR